MSGATIQTWAHADAWAIAKWLVDLWARGGVIVAGIRRLEPRVAGIEILIPIQPDAADGLYGTMQSHVVNVNQAAPMLFGNPATTFLVPGKGFKPGFRDAAFQLDPVRARSRKGFPFVDDRPIPVRVRRFDDGPQGNAGWSTLIWTGPNDFGRACLWRWGQVSRGGYSKDGYPHTKDHRRLVVPTEDEAWRLLEMAPVAPKDRNVTIFPGWNHEQRTS